MKGKLKALGLALVAAMAMSAVAAGSASAENETVNGEFTIDENAETLIAEGTNQLFTTTVDQLFCESVEAEVDKKADFGPEQVTAQPHYTDCEAQEQEIDTHVHMNSCDYLFTADTTDGHAPVHIECDPGDEIEIKITLFGERPCVEVPAQTPTSGGVTYQNGTYVENEANHWDVRIDATVEGIKYTEVGGSFCTDSEDDVVVNNGTYEGEVTVKAEDNLSNPVDITHSE